MEEFTTSVKQNDGNANQAKVLAIGASEIAAEGGRVVADSPPCMAFLKPQGKFRTLLA